MADLEAKLKEAAGARYRLIATDGVFSMDGYIAKLAADLRSGRQVRRAGDGRRLARRRLRRRTRPRHARALRREGRIDILTGTLGKALGGASGGYTSGRKEIVELLRQRSRPYLFSNSVAPPIVAASLKVLDLVSESTELRERLRSNTAYFREAMTKEGFNILPGEHPIVPVMFGDATIAARMAELLLAKGVYVIAFSYPVVPMGKARIRTQISAAHSRHELEFAVKCFAEAKRELD